MHHRNTYQLMAEYNCWMNQNIYQVCESIPDEQRKQDRGAFFKSIHGTLNHLLYGDKVWMGRFTNQPFLGTSLSQELYADFAELRAEREQTDQQILDWSKSLDPDWLNQPFEYVSQSDQKQRVMPAWILVTHLFNHQTHHRGQVTTLIKQLGYEPGVTDIPWMPGVSGLGSE
ncbi:DinB family protein [Laspinema olomoucense]|uniref:DinB family protein n=1 Tax=Laspinema olomoucense D3b TaxID=2953688 RepID=A0ABT2N3R3_9CYAN|nr:MULTISPECIES: DinB family protein [unclassified Laspinema]MCT7972035.1 DinB family protein [Laspinema sp. D3d]MCT7976514.1 DinB family protein [Laspinema sp. D3b]MCT7990088.1 DinB family protein [Laspinema sp. D3a]MCT7994943.1 DinB family protein [Laspinema sp. D3c]